MAKANKKLTVVLIVLVLVVGGLSGCLGSERSAEDDEKSIDDNFWSYIRAVGESSDKTLEIHRQMMEASKEGDYTNAIELTNEMKRLNEEGMNYAQLAANVANNEAEKKWAECLVNSYKYAIQYDEKLIESIKYKRDGEEEKAIETIKVANNISREFSRHVDFCSELKPNDG